MIKDRLLKVLRRKSKRLHENMNGFFAEVFRKKNLSQDPMVKLMCEKKQIKVFAYSLIDSFTPANIYYITILE